MKTGRPPQTQLIRECMQDLRDIVRALEDYSSAVEMRFGLTRPQLWALWELGDAGPLALKDLAIKMRLDPSTVVGVVDRLVAKNLVVRNPDAKDRRRVSLTLTAAGSELVHAAPHPAQGHLLVGLENLEPRHVEALRDALRTLATVLEDQGLEAPFYFTKD